jgi:hypothetical protein
LSKRLGNRDRNTTITDRKLNDGAGDALSQLAVEVDVGSHRR